MAQAITASGNKKSSAKLKACFYDSVICFFLWRANVRWRWLYGEKLSLKRFQTAARLHGSKFKRAAAFHWRTWNRDSAPRAVTGSCRVQTPRKCQLGICVNRFAVHFFHIKLGRTLLLLSLSLNPKKFCFRSRSPDAAGSTTLIWGDAAGFFGVCGSEWNEVVIRINWMCHSPVRSDGFAMHGQGERHTGALSRIFSSCPRFADQISVFCSSTTVGSSAEYLLKKKSH